MGQRAGDHRRKWCPSGAYLAPIENYGNRAEIRSLEELSSYSSKPNFSCYNHVRTKCKSLSKALETVLKVKAS